MFELECEGAEDFLFLFESVQDVAILDSESEPTRICVYQVKKKDRGEWTWNELTRLILPSKKNALAQDFKIIKESPVGKLYASVLSLKSIEASGKFISNSACVLPLEGGQNAATSLACDLSRLEKSYLSLLEQGLKTLHEVESSVPMPSLICVEKVPIHPDAPSTYLNGIVLAFLSERSPKHAGQARSLVDGLLAKIGPLGAKTKSCNTFDLLKKERGYSKRQFRAAIGSLELVPDQIDIMNTMLTCLIEDGGATFMEAPAIRLAAANLFRKQLLGEVDPEADAVFLACDRWLMENNTGNSIKECLEKARRCLAISSLVSHSQFTAQFLLRLANKCADLI